MGPIYQFHGLSVDCIDKHEPNSAARKKAYACNITFGTNNEFGFDYLRDNMATSMEDLVQRKHHFAIVDEVDSVLIDDARTPLIISAPAGDNPDSYYQFAKIAAKLGSEDYVLDDVFFWTMPQSDLRWAENYWNHIKANILANHISTPFVR